MEDEGRAAESLPHSLLIANVEQRDVDAGAMAVEQPADISLDTRAREVVDDANVLAPLDQDVDEIRTDETGASRHERHRALRAASPAHHRVSPRASSCA
jgi:hypothetical protein